MSTNQIYKAYPYLNGKFLYDLPHIDAYSPVDGHKIGEIYGLDAKLLALLYKSAAYSFHVWKKISPQMRIKKMQEFAETMLADKAALASLMALEIAKSHKDCLVEIERSYEYIIQTIAIYEKEFLNPQVIDQSQHGIANKKGYFFQEPIGVVLAISPFNYPINLSVAKIIPALLTGNSVVLKPATQSSLTASRIATYFDKIKMIPGAFSLILGKGSEIGDAIISNPVIAGVTFTGSTSVGKNLAAKSPMRQVILEMGGKDPAIVTNNNQDLAKVAKEIVKGAFNYSGQRCTAIKRVLVTKEIADQLVAALKTEIEQLKVGHPMDNADITPVIDEHVLKYNLALIEDAIAHKAVVVTGNEVIGHNLLKPTLVDHVSLKSKLAWEEPFGPVLPVIRVATIQEAITIANQSEYGLQGSVFSDNQQEALAIANQLETGSVNINRSSARGPDIFPFVGIKSSGFGAQGIRQALYSMTRIKGIVVND